MQTWNGGRFANEGCVKRTMLRSETVNDAFPCKNGERTAACAHVNNGAFHALYNSGK